MTSSRPDARAMIGQNSESIAPKGGISPGAHERPSPDLRKEHGPFDIIGDVHGCASELRALLAQLGYGLRDQPNSANTNIAIENPARRKAVFVGDLVDRGPASPGVLRIVMAMVEGGHAFAVPGNHDIKFLRWLTGKQVKISHGLGATVEQISSEPIKFRHCVQHFMESLPVHIWLAGGALAVAHAGIKQHMLGRSSGEIRSFCLYGETSGETDEFGLPIRYHWAAGHSGETAIVYGHTPVPEAEWVNNTLCVDTGCCFGGKLTALRWPEREIVSVPAQRTYAPPVRPFGHPPVRPGSEP